MNDGNLPALGRLTRGTTANTTSANTWDISWIYDRYGNRTNQTENAGTLLVGNENVTFDTHNCITGGFACGASGNMSNDGINNNYIYDAENRYVKLGSTLVNTYDGSSLRIKKVTGSSTTVYVYSGSKVIAEYDPAAAVTAPTEEYIYLGSQILATLDASHNPTYRHPDHLSVRMYSDNSGTVIGTQGHLPFGEAWYSTGTVDKWRFTTYERDTDTNLDYAINRFDSARLARFMSPDSYRGSIDVRNPQSWNRYPYVGNDPVNLIDPTGLQGTCTTEKCLEHHNNDDLAYYSIGPMNLCSIEWTPAPCPLAYRLLGSGAGVYCPQCQPGQLVGNDYKIWGWKTPTYGATCDNWGCGPGFLKSPGGWQPIGGLDQSPFLFLGVFPPGMNGAAQYFKYATRGKPPTNLPNPQNPIWPQGPAPEVNPPLEMPDVPWYKSVPLKLLELFDSLGGAAGDVLFMVDPCLTNPSLRCGPDAPPQT